MSEEEARFEQVQTTGDLDEVLAIERASFANPWTWDMFRWEMENGPISRLYVLKDVGGRIRAFCSIWIVASELHINNLAVAPAWRRQGLGRALLTRVLAAGVAEGVREATLEVRRSNLAARRLYEDLGFVVAGVRRDYYTNPLEDALILWKTGLDRPSDRPGPAGPGGP